MKKTQFTDILKIKKNKIKEIEQKIQKVRFGIAKNQERIKEIEEDILNIEYPISGYFSVLQQYNLAMNNMKSDIYNLENQIEQANNIIAQLQEELKLANLEFEKFKFLNDEVLEKEAKRLKKLEENRLDEIAIILFNQKRN
jgi:flagellar biosynthesis chaperone FliJ